jgi:hypothetical protein
MFGVASCCVATPQMWRTSIRVLHEVKLPVDELAQSVLAQRTRPTSAQQAGGFLETRSPCNALCS